MQWIMVLYSHFSKGQYALYHILSAKHNYVPLHIQHHEINQVCNWNQYWLYAGNCICLFHNCISVYCWLIGKAWNRSDDFFYFIQADCEVQKSCKLSEDEIVFIHNSIQDILLLSKYIRDINKILVRMLYQNIFQITCLWHEKSWMQLIWLPRRFVILPTIVTIHQYGYQQGSNFMLGQYLKYLKYPQFQTVIYLTIAYDILNP